MLTISGKAMGRRKPLFDDFGIALPPGFGEESGVTLRDLIERIVLAEVKAFRQRQANRQLLRCLSPAQVEEAAEKGKIDCGGSELLQEVDAESAVATALTAFEDGLYLVVLDGEEQRRLDDQVFLQPDSRITFVRLMLLAGG